MRLSPSSVDADAVRVVARLRLAVAVVAAAAGSYGSSSNRASTVFVLLGLVWVPWATMVLFAADRPGSRWAVVGGPAGDVVVLFCVQALVPGTGDAVLLGYLVVVAFAGYTAGRSVSAPLAGLALPLVLVADQFRSGSAAISGGLVVVLSAALAALVLLLDRTALLQSRAEAHSSRMEGKAEAILARVADAVIVTDAGGWTVQCNPAAERLLAGSADQIAGRSCAEVLGLHVGERPLDCSARCALLALADPAGGVLGHETWRVDASGRRRPILANAEAVVDAAGRTVEVVHSLRDVTRIKEAEEAKTLFLATASHELKTPLTVIKGFADTLLAFEDLDRERQRAALEAIRIRADQLARIVDRLLLSSRIEAGRVQVTLTSLEVPPLLDERVRALWAATGRRVDLEVEEPIPAAIADPQALITVIDHLLDNALKYSPGGEPVTVGVHAVDGAVVVEVADRGIGMDEEQAARCFEKFWQAESSDVRRFGGTGIGLYIVRSMVEAMGGQLTVRSAPGAGSTFAVSLPTELPEEPADPRDAGEATSIREFMRQIGVPARSA